MLTDYLYETMSSGGWVIAAILLVGALGFSLAGLAVFELKGDFFRRDYSGFFQEVFDKLKRNDRQGASRMLEGRPGMVTHGLWLAIEHSHMTEGALRNFLAEKLNRGVFLAGRHLPLITVLASAAPLLGLLGTVTGMVHTFQVITEYGNSNPLLLAGGISEALITTQSGLLIAFPLMLFKHHLEERISWMKKQVELGITQFINQRYYS